MTDKNGTLVFRHKSASSVWEDSNNDTALQTGTACARCLIIHPYLRSELKSNSKSYRDPAARLDEAVSLSAAIDLQVIRAVCIPLAKIVPAHYLGKGKLEEIKGFTDQNEIELVVMDCELSPVQQRNLESTLGVKVIDRTGLILEIFGERAQTKEGGLQVELAHLSYQKSRLVRSWTHLERQRGGGGFMGGPGERQIESDRRQIDEQIIKIRKKLDQVVKTRGLHRKARKKVPFPIVALVGYTNAGKSTLFNRLTNANVMAKDILFATLDPTMRKINLPCGKTIILSDTVGFISDLPTSLIAAFRATLEEVIEADLILHIRDISHQETDEQANDVIEIMRDLGIEEEAERSIFEVWNKSDLLDEESFLSYCNISENRDNISLISAVTGKGMDKFLALISSKLSEKNETLEFTFSHDEGADVAWLYRHAEVLSREDDESSITLTVSLDQKTIGQLEKKGLIDKDKSKIKDEEISFEDRLIDGYSSGS